MYLKISPDIFLEKAELDRLKMALDDDGFRAFLLDNSVSFGFIRKHNAPFTNGLVQEDVGNTISIATAELIDSAGNVIMGPATQQMAVPNDGHWYWVKITYAPSSQEKGIYSIDSLGNLTCTSANGELTKILRGQPNFPSRIRFLNATNNVLSYDVEEVIDDNHAVLTGVFSAEAALTLSVVGTFTPGSVPLSSEQDIFQYDSAIISLIQSDTSTEPAHTVGTEFFMARVRIFSGSIYIEDKRNDIWTTNANYFAQNLTRLNNPLIGVEQITFDDQFTPRDKNMLEVAWGFRGVTFAVNLKLNKITISAGSGGRYRVGNFSTQFTNGDFDNWRIYTLDGKYFNVVTSVYNAGTIELLCDNLEATSFFSDVNSSVPINQVINVVPDAEEIEIICIPSPDTSDPTATNGIVEIHSIFPINSLFGRIPLTVYNPTLSSYIISYRYKHLRSYGPELLIPDDTVSGGGYYNEMQFNIHGYRTGSAQTIYTAATITLKLSSFSYTNFNLGDLSGIATVALSNSIPDIHLVVGTSKKYQYFSGTPLALSADMFIILEKYTDYPTNTIIARNGNTFKLQFKQPVTLNGHNLFIVTDFVSPSSYTLLKQFTSFDEAFLATSEQGILVETTFDGANWVVTNTNETQYVLNTYSQVKRAHPGTTPGAGPSMTYDDILVLDPVPRNLTNVVFKVSFYTVTSSGGGGLYATMGLAVKINGTLLAGADNQINDVMHKDFFGANYVKTTTFVLAIDAPLNKGDIVTILFGAAAGFTPPWTVATVHAEMSGDVQY